MLTLALWLFTSVPADGGRVWFVWDAGGGLVSFGFCWYFPIERVYVVPMSSDNRSAWVGLVRVSGGVTETLYTLRYCGLRDVWTTDLVITHYPNMRVLLVGRFMYVYRGG